MREKEIPFFTYYNRVSEIIASVSQLQIQSLIYSLRNTYLNRGTVYVLGNGGSASTASHFANDLGIITKRRGLFINSISLVDNVASITAIGNDDSFDNIFKIQLTHKLKKEDLVFCISASGNSVNLINAVKFAKEIGSTTTSLLGFDGGELKVISDNHCLVPTNIGEYGPVEDAHLSICHYLASVI